MLSLYACRSMISVLAVSMDRAVSARPVRMPRPSISTTLGPRWMVGRRSIPCASSVRWSMRASWPAISSARLAWSAHAARVFSSHALGFKLSVFCAPPCPGFFGLYLLNH